jgi:hypothetical protein
VPNEWAITNKEDTFEYAGHIGEVLQADGHSSMNRSMIV